MNERLTNWFYFCAGIIFLMLAKGKSILQGYSTPKPFSINEIRRSVEYDLGVVDRWIKQLNIYTKDNKLITLYNRNILELGPGSDLGVGLYLLSKGAKEYIAIDVNNLISNTPEQFYNLFFDYLRMKNIDTSDLEKELANVKNGRRSKMDYIARKDFSIVNALDDRKVDIVFSNAAFEHFDSVFGTISELSSVSKPGTIFIALVDLKTHSRWIRDNDPINIYRYSKWLYNFLCSSGSPNRIRPYRYKQALEVAGWENVTITPASTLENDKYNFVKKYLDSEFLEVKNEMNYLSIWICATKGN